MMKAEWQIIDLIIEVQKTMKLTKKTLLFMTENPVILVRKKFRYGRRTHNAFKFLRYT